MFKSKKISVENKLNKGFILVAATLVMLSVVLLVFYFLDFVISDINISQSQSYTSKAYYLAEIGVNDMINKISYDSGTRNAFISGALTSGNDISRNDIYGLADTGYEVTAVSTAPGEAQIHATSTYMIGGRTSQRVVKSYISMATSQVPEWDISGYSGSQGHPNQDSFKINGAGIDFTVSDGRIHSNQSIKVSGGGNILTINDGMISASGSIQIGGSSQVILNNSQQVVPTSTIDFLIIDIDSNDPNSIKNRATQTFSSSAFASLPANTVLEGIIYVNGDANISRNMTINGVLASPSNIVFNAAGRTLTVNYNATYGAGLIAKNDVVYNGSGLNSTVNGLIYAAREFKINGSGINLTINGAFLGFQTLFNGTGHNIILNFVPENIGVVIDPNYNEDAALIRIDHWEEEY